MPYLGALGSHFEKPLSYLKSAPSKLSYGKVWCFMPRICLIPKFREKKKKVSKFGIKNALFGYFWARILKKLLSYLKSAPSNLYDSKSLIWVFLGQTFQKTIVIFEICLITKFRKKKNKIKIWDEKWLICVIQGYNLKKLLSYLKSTISNFSKMSF